ncbi:MAG: carboxypeptidase regulatory-like domain-containing protein [Planctomycetes bacterium]|nr:carboxypeptidase regulatory-like domain-containing protein [Planctomycetota bacterium]
MPHPRARARAGASRALLVVGLALALFAALVAWWAFRGDDAATRALGLGGEARTAAAPSGELAAADAAGERAGTQLELALVTPSGMAIPVGVRLRGNGSLSGRVLDRGTGAPVADARVDLLPLPPGGAQVFGRMLRLANFGEDFAKRMQPIAIAATDGLGQFAFEGVRAGSYYVEARGAYSVPDQPLVAKVLASGVGGPLDVWVRSGGRIVGSVVDARGSAVSSATVVVTAGVTNFVEAARTADLCYLESVSDARGAFTLSGVPPGTGWEVSATGATMTVSHVGELTVRAGEDTVVRLVARTGATVRGRLFSVAAVDAEAPATDRKPLTGAHVGAVPRGLREIMFIEEVLAATHAITDADGRYTMQNVPPGEIDVLAIAAGHLAAKGTSLWVSDGSTSDATEFELRRGPLARGRVVDSAGLPVADVQVRWEMVDMQNFQFDFTLAPLLAQAVKGFDVPRTDAAGLFEAGPFAGKAPHEIGFWRLGYERATVNWDPKDTGELLVTLKRGGAVEGVVMDAKKHEPVTRFTVAGQDLVDAERDAPGSMNPYSGGQLVEDDAGRFRVEPVKTGKASLTFRAPGYLPETIDDLEIVEGDVTRGVIVELDPGATIEGRVTDKEGQPVVGAILFAAAKGERTDGERRPNRRGRRGEGPVNFGRDAPAGFAAQVASLGLLGDAVATTDAEGRYRLIGVESGKVVVTATHREYVPARSAPLDVPQGGTASVDLVLGKGGGIEGLVTDRWGKPVVGSIVIAMSPGNIESNGGALYQGRTDPEGRFRIERMAGGGYFLVLTRGDESLHPMSFFGTLKFDFATVPADEMVEYDLVDDSSGAARVYGRVTADGEPVERGNIVAVSFESESMLGVDMKIAPIKEGGAFEFPGLAPGGYQFKLNDVGVGRRNVTAEIQVEIPDQPEVRLDLELPHGGVEGHVIDAATKRPIAGVEVSLRNTMKQLPDGIFAKLIAQDDSLRERTDDQGAFRFEHLQSSTYEVTVRSSRWGDGPRYAPSAPLAIRLGEGPVERGVEIALEPSLAIVGVVKSTEGAPIAGASVLAVAKERPDVRPERATTDAEGRFKIESVGAGRFDVSATHERFAGAKIADFELVKGEEKSVEIVLQEGVPVKVRVSAADGSPLSGATATLTAKGGAATGDVTDWNRTFNNLFEGKGVTDTRGELELGYFAPGAYALSVRRAFQKAEQDVEIDAGGEVVLRVTLR